MKEGFGQVWANDWVSRGELLNADADWIALTLGLEPDGVIDRSPLAIPRDDNQQEPWLLPATLTATLSENRA